ncbi:hypothetical protein [Clostridium sp. UBA1652]|uniref:hypothetical protein n=1 Tax=Clostridium sp. UBA1652 TaxID=1946348 RepID=UPI00257B35FF|nr:hypothetical protein [Clostridium sp. UBA1652]
MKKFVTVLLVSILTLLPISVQASTIKPTSPLENEVLQKIGKPKMTKTQINEYTLYKDLNKASDEELISDGWSSNKIESFKKYNFVETVKERSKLSIDELKNMGYSDDKINLLKTTTNWTEDKLMAVSSTLYLQGGAGLASNNNRNWNFYYEWGWDSNPGFVGYDIVAARWSGTTNGTVANATLIDSRVQIYMMDIDNGNQMVYSNILSLDKVDINAGSANFRGYYVMAGKRCNALAGYAQFTVSNTKPMEVVTMSFKYGHATSSLTLSPSISLSGPSVDFSFSKGVNESGRILETYNPDGTIYQG